MISHDSSRFPRFSMVLLALVILLPFSIKAQIPGADKSMGGVNAGMVKLFGPNTNFIAKTEARVYDKKMKETTFMPLGFEMLGGSIRVDVNLALLKSKEMSAEIVSQMKQLGMDQLTTIQSNEKKSNLQIYPSLKSYVETPMTKEETDGLAREYKVEKAAPTKDTIDGHVCDKTDVTITDDKGVKQKAIVWYAKDLKDFPIQIEATEDDSTLVLRFKEIKLGRPDAARFATPASMKKYDTAESLMTDAAMKKISNLVPSK